MGLNPWSAAANKKKRDQHTRVTRTSQSTQDHRPTCPLEDEVQHLSAICGDVKKR